MNKKMLGICLAAAVISTGTLGGVVASEVADRSLMAANALENSDSNTCGNIRFWVSSDMSNPLGSGYAPVLWFHGYGNIDFAPSVTEAKSVINTAEKGDREPNGRQYWYIDVPYVDGLEEAQLTLQIFDTSTKAHNKTTSTFKTEDCINKVLYIWKDWNTASIGPVASISYEMAATALDGLYSCSGSEFNGYKALEKFSETFIWKDYDLRNSGDNSNWRVVGYLHDAYCTDYADGALWTDPNTPRDTSVNAQVKLDELVQRYELSKVNMAA